MRFTDKGIAALKPRRDRYELTESRTGLAVRVNPSGTKSFSYLYSLAGAPRRATLGVYRGSGLVAVNGALQANARGVPYVSLADARVKLAECQRLLQAGIDPAGQQTAAHRTERKAESVADLVKAYLEKHAETAKRKSSAREDKRQLEKDVLPRWRTRRARDISKGDVTGLLDDVVSRGSPIGANRLRAVIRKMFAFGVRRGLVPANPVADVDKPAKERKRERILTDAEIKAVWSASMDQGMYGQMIRLLLILGQRRGEVAGMPWAEVDMDSKTWTLPGSRTKNGLPHAVPLPQLVLDILAKRPRKHGDEPEVFVFPSKPGSDRRFCAFRYAKALLDKAIVEASEDGKGIAPWTVHDLRRTMRTNLSKLRIDSETAERLIGHVPTGVRSVYDLHEYLDEKREALDRWTARLAQIVAD